MTRVEELEVNAANAPPPTITADHQCQLCAGAESSGYFIITDTSLSTVMCDK